MLSKCVWVECFAKSTRVKKWAPTKNGLMLEQKSFFLTSQFPTMNKTNWRKNHFEIFNVGSFLHLRVHIFGSTFKKHEWFIFWCITLNNSHAFFGIPCRSVPHSLRHVYLLKYRHVVSFSFIFFVHLKCLSVMCMHVHLYNSLFYSLFNCVQFMRVASRTATVARITNILWLHWKIHLV